MQCTGSNGLKGLLRATWQLRDCCDRRRLCSAPRSRSVIAKP